MSTSNRLSIPDLLQHPTLTPSFLNSVILTPRSQLAFRKSGVLLSDLQTVTLADFQNSLNPATCLQIALSTRNHFIDTLKQAYSTIHLQHHQPHPQSSTMLSNELKSIE